MKEYEIMLEKMKNLRNLNYKNYLETEHWLHFREEVLKSCDCCVVCGSNEFLQIHHKNYKNIGRETFNDVAVLCDCCHCKLHNIQPKHPKLKLFQSSHIINNFRTLKSLEDIIGADYYKNIIHAWETDQYDIFNSTFKSFDLESGSQYDEDGFYNLFYYLGKALQLFSKNEIESDSLIGIYIGLNYNFYTDYDVLPYFIFRWENNGRTLIADYK